MEEPIVSVLVASFEPSCDNAAYVFAKRLRAEGVSCVVDARHKRIKKMYDWAVVLRTFYLVLIGTNEVASGTVTLKDLDEKTQAPLAQADAIDLLTRMCVAPEERRLIELRRVVDEDLALRTRELENLLNAPPLAASEARPEAGTVDGGA